jgi:membrane-bound serine protease (ClpP class)
MRRRAFLTLALLLSPAVARGWTPTVYRISVSGTVENGLAPHVARSLREARAGYAKSAASGEPELLRTIGLANARVIASEPLWAEQVVRFLTNPLVSPLLLSIGVLGLLFEVKTGAFGLGGLLSLIALGLFFGSSFLLGLAGWEEVLLLGLGLLALVVEVFVIPGFGAAGILGAVALAAAIVLAMIGGSPTAGDVMQAFAVLGASLVITLAVAYAWLRHLPSSGRFAGLFLHGGAAQSEGYISAVRRADLVGLDGVALTDLRPAGAAQFGVERIDAVTAGEYVAQGTPVRVVRSEGYRHVVRGLA